MAFDNPKRAENCEHCGGYDNGGLVPHCSGCGRPLRSLPSPSAEPDAVIEAAANYFAEFVDDPLFLTVADARRIITRHVGPELSRLRQRVAELELFEKLANEQLDKTADGAFVCECEKFYCPQCGEETERSDSFGTYCWNCPNPDSGNEAPLPLMYGMVLSKPVNTKGGV